MKTFFLIMLILLLYGCNKPKSVLICGDHICVNKEEAKQYFEKNLVLEVRIIDKKNSKNVNLVELNLKSNTDEKKQINLIPKKNTTTKIKVLSKDEIKKKKIQLKKNKVIKNVNRKSVKKIEKKKKEKSKKKIIQKAKKVNKPNKEIVDICTVLNKCTIDEISEYLIKKGKSDNFPDITTRE